ncbi:MAG TPA: hypothetical protein VLT89_08875 [Usitatibacter sp.]|nr:hypothetical protein [Usitatibacter sp.]
MDDLEREIARRLEAVAGSRYEEDKDALRRWRNRFVKWIVAAVAAVGAAALVFYTLESHRLPPTLPKPKDSPVTVTIVPAKPP